MRVFLRLWLVLFPTFSLARIFLSVEGFNHIDLRFENFAQLLLTPVVQAAGLALLLEGVPMRAARETGKFLWAHSLPRTLIVLDGGLLVVLSLLPWVGVGRLSEGLTILNFIKSLLAGTLALLLGVLRFGPWKSLFLLGLGLALYGLGSWPAGIDETLAGWLSGRPLLIRWILFFPPLLAAAGILIGRLAGYCRNRLAPASILFELVFLPALAAAVIVILSVFNRPFLLYPWLEIALVLKSVALTLLILGLTVLATTPRSELIGGS